MENNLNNNIDPGENKTEIVEAKARPITETENADAKIGNISIGKVGNLTLNFFTKPLKQHYEKHYKKNKMHLVADMLLAIIIVILILALANLWIFSKTKSINLTDFSISSAPEQLTNGQMTDFTIHYANKTEDTLSAVQIVLKEPKALHDPQYNVAEFNKLNHSLAVGDLAAKASGDFKVSGLLLGNFDQKQEFIAVISYKNKYGQERQEFFSQKFQLSQSALAVQINLPKTAKATSPFDAQISLANNSKIDFANLKIKLNLPANYELNDFNGGQNLGSTTWKIGELKSLAKAQATATGQIYTAEPQEREIGADIYVNYGQQEYLIARAKSNILIDLSKFKIEFRDLEKNHSVTPGQNLTYTIYYKNNEAYNVSNVSFGLKIKGEYAANEKIAGKTIKRIEPGQEGVLEISVGTKANIDFSDIPENGYQLMARATVGFDDPQEKNRLAIESNSLSTIINAKLNLNSNAIFFTPSGDQIGVGSIPPAVGEYTSYWVIIRAVNTNNALKDLKITATVPEDIEFNNIYNVTAGKQISYDNKTRQITWEASDVPAFSGISSPAPELRIQLAITPTEKQINKSPNLLTNIIATATDAKTNAFITASAKNINIAIFEDQALNKVIE